MEIEIEIGAIALALQRLCQVLDCRRLAVFVSRSL
jgi:hypothetical protein